MLIPVENGAVEDSASGPWVLRDGRRLLNAASNDYLGLSQHPRLIEAVADAARQYGVGSGASRLVTGTGPLQQEAEKRFAEFKHAPAALLCTSGYAANLAVLATLPQSGDVVLHDKLNHASLIDATRAGEGTMRTFPHRDLTSLDRKLTREHQRLPTDSQVFVVTDSVFSMDGDTADLSALLDLCDRHDAVLVADEAHATGVLGDTGSGLAEAQGVAGRIPITISTSSKALGSLGGIVTASQPVIEHLVNHARAFIYTTGVPPTQAAGIAAALHVIADEPERRERLCLIVEQVRQALAPHWPSIHTKATTPILPLIVGDAADALSLSEQLAEAGVLAIAIRPPTVAPGSARVRLTLRADMTDDDVAMLIDAVTKNAGFAKR